MLKQTLACNKVHIPTKALERGIVMPRDLDNYHPEFPSIMATLLRNPYREKKETKKKTSDKMNNKNPIRRLTSNL